MAMDRPAVRKLLQLALRSASDLEAFCGDYFPEVRERFTLGMDQVQQLTILLDDAGAPAILSALRQACPDAVRKFEDAQKAQVQGVPGAERPGRLHHVPELPPHFLGRPDEMASLKRMILGPRPATVAVTGRAARTGVQGMGGIGKTVLAASVAREGDVRLAFPDGIFWITLGQSPPLAERQAALCKAFGEPGAALQDEHEGKARLTELLADRACLLVLDDAWQIDHVTAFGATGPRGRVLFTTRDASIAAGLGAETHRLDVLNEEQALQMLGDWAAQPVDTLAAEAQLVARECGYLPLALAMIGAMVRGRPDRWGNALHKLRAADLGAIRRSFPDYPYPDLLRAIEVSVEALGPAARARYLDFAVFPEDTAVPEAVLKTLWSPLGIDTYGTQDLLDLFLDRSLLRRDEAGCFRLHDLQRDYVVKHAGDIPALHNRLLAAYAECSSGGASGPEDGYYFTYLAYHLSRAGRDGELRRLLLDFEWLRAKLKATDPVATLLDFAFLRTDQALAAVEGAIRLSAHVLSEDAGQLASQLVGRLLHAQDSEVAAFVARVASLQTRPWLRPATASLIPPGGPLLRTLSGHSGAITMVAMTPDGRFAVSGSTDRILKAWDLKRGEELRSLSHSSALITVALTADGCIAVSGLVDGTLKVWDLQRGCELHSLAAHSGLVTAVAVTPDGRFAVSGSDEGSLKVWCLQSGRELRSLAGHRRRIIAVSAPGEGQWVISGSDDGTVKVWELERGCELRTFVGASRWVSTMAVTPDGRLALTNSTDGTLKVSEVCSGRALLSLKVRGVHATAVTADGRLALLGSRRGMLAVWEMRDRCEPRTLSVVSEGITAVAVAADGHLALSGSRNGILRVWTLDSTREAVAGGAPCTPAVAIPVWALDSTREAVAGSNHAGYVSAVAVTADGSLALSGSISGELKVWEVETGRELHSLPGHRDVVTAVAVTDDGRFAISGSHDGTVRISDIEDTGEPQTFSGDARTVRALAATADAYLVFSGSADGELRVWELESGHELHMLLGHPAFVQAVAVTTDRCFAISGSCDGTLKVWDLATGRQRRTLSGHSSWVNAVALSAHDRWVISASNDQTLKVWELESGRELRTLSGHSYRVSAVAATADGRWAISGSGDRTLKVWDLQSGTVLATFTADSAISAVAATPDGRCIVAGDTLGTVHFLRLEGI